MIDFEKLAQTAQVVCAADAWRTARRALMKASADGQKWTPELVERLTTAETRLEQTLDVALNRNVTPVPGDYGPDPDFG